MAPPPRVVRPKGLLPGEGTSFTWKWPVDAVGARDMVNGGILHPFNTAALAFIWGEEGTLRQPPLGVGRGRECGAVKTHLSSRVSPCKGHSPSLAFVADL